MKDWDKYLEKLQHSTDQTKRMVMLAGVPLVMAVVVFMWISLLDFRNGNEAAAQEEGISKFQIFKNGFKASYSEIKLLAVDLKNKIVQTNSFQFETPDGAATTTNLVLEDIATTTNIKK